MIVGKMLSLLTIAIFVEVCLCQTSSGPAVGLIGNDSIANASAIPSAQEADNVIELGPPGLGSNHTELASNISHSTDKSIVVISDHIDNSIDNHLNSNDSQMSSANVEVATPTSVASNQTQAIIQQVENQTKESDVSPSSVAIDSNHTQEVHRISKRSFDKRHSLHMNLDDLVNMKRQRRASMRYKRDNARDELLEQLLFGNTNANPSEQETDDSDDDNTAKYIDRDSLLRLYNTYLPYLVAQEAQENKEQEDNEIAQEPTIILDEYGNPVLASRALPHYPNRYERILASLNNPDYRRTYRKRSGGYSPLWRYGFGRIMPARRDKSAYDEANKIYMIGSLLARTEGAPEKRSKRWARMNRPVIKNM